MTKAAPTTLFQVQATAPVRAFVRLSEASPAAQAKALAALGRPVSHVGLRDKRKVGK